MDPDANLEETERLEARVRTGTLKEGDLDRLNELRAALRQWIQNGGFPPAKWAKTKNP